MHRAYFRTITAVLVALWSIMPALADISPKPGSFSLDDLFSRSTQVVRGEVISVTQSGQEFGEPGGRAVALNVFRAAVKIDRAYKGTTDGSSVLVTFVRPAGNQCVVSVCTNFVSGEFDLLFLVKNDSEYRLADSFFGKFRASRLRSAAQQDGLDSLRSDLIAGFSDADDFVSMNMIQLIGNSRLSSIAPLLQILPSTTGKKRAMVHFALLRQHEYSQLGNLSEVFAPTVGPDPHLRSLQYGIVDEINDIRDLQAVPALRKLSKSDSDALREAAVHALRGIASPEAAPQLVAALDDPIELIRYDAVMGLAAMNNSREFAPSTETFRRDEQKYISHWKGWWANRQPSR